MSGLPSGAMPPKPMSGSAPSSPTILTFPRQIHVSSAFANIKLPQAARQVRLFSRSGAVAGAVFSGRDPVHAANNRARFQDRSGTEPGFLVIAMLLSCSLASAGFGQEHAVDTGYSPEDRPEPTLLPNEPRQGPNPGRAGSEMVDLEALKRTAGGLIRSGLRWYLRTPAVECDELGRPDRVRGTGPCGASGLSPSFRFSGPEVITFSPPTSPLTKTQPLRCERTCTGRIRAFPLKARNTTFLPSRSRTAVVGTNAGRPGGGRFVFLI